MYVLIALLLSGSLVCLYHALTMKPEDYEE